MLFIGPGHPVIPVQHLLSNSNLYEFNTIVALGSWVVSDIESWWQVNGVAGLAAVQDRLQRLNAWVEDGHTLILIADRVTVGFAYAAGGKQKAFHLQTILPFSLFGFDDVAGTAIETCAPLGETPILTTRLSEFNYRYVLSGRELKPLLRARRATSGEQQVVAAVKSHGTGQVIVVPKFSGNDSLLFISDLAALPTAIRGERSEVPDWVSSFRTAIEVAAVAELGVLEAKVSSIRRDMDMQQGILDQDQELKRLMTTTGSEFVQCVIGALEFLGFKVVEGPHPRADLLASEGARILAIEAKGLEGCVKERNITQAMRWAAEVASTLASSPEDRAADADLVAYAERLEIIGIPTKEPAEFFCKPVVVVGTFRKTPLNERSEPNFPHPVERILARSNVAALTGLQLLGLVLLVRAGNLERDDARKMLFDTNGVIAAAREWTEFMSNAPEHAKN